MLLLKRLDDRYKSIIILVLPLILSSYTHLWNPVGFPSVWVVEGQYMHRAMHALEGLGVHEPTSIYPHLYDHPHFGPIFLASVLKVVAYPESLEPSANLHSIETLYLVPRVLMGLLSVVDTFLVYIISMRRYNNKAIALTASVLFSVMPISWILRKIFLESILLPLLLLSILFAVCYSSKKRGVNKDNKTGTKNIATNPIRNKKGRKKN